MKESIQTDRSQAAVRFCMVSILENCSKVSFEASDKHSKES